MRLRICVFDSVTKEMGYEYVNGRIYKEFFCIDKRESPLYWVVTHIPTGCSVVKGIKSQKLAMDLVDEIESIINWSVLRIGAFGLTQGSKRITEKKKALVQQVLDRYINE